MESNNYLIYKLSDLMKRCTKIDAELFRKMDVKRGLRNEDGTGVLVGLTNIGNVVGYERQQDGTLLPIDGKLYLRGYEISDLVNAILEEKRFGFEEVAYLLLSGNLPDKEEVEEFHNLLVKNMPLEKNTLLHIIELEGGNIMNILARSVLELYTFDPNPDDTSRENLMRQSIELMSKFPTIIAYAYNMLRHGEQGRSLHIRHPQKDLSFAENFLFMLKGKDYTPLEARTLDLMLIRSLKGPKHGGANLKVTDMLNYLKNSIDDWSDDKEIEQHLEGILTRNEYDGQGLIYGIGHAVYTVSDPRAVLLKRLAGELAAEKHRVKEYEFMQRIEQLAIQTIYRVKGHGKTMCANVDFYSGFVYDMIGIPQDIYTPLFAMSRIVGWCAHRNEELNFEGRRIIRPAYRCVTDERSYASIDRR